MSSVKWRLSRLGLNVLITTGSHSNAVALYDSHGEEKFSTKMNIQVQRFSSSPNRKWLGKRYKALETFDSLSPILSWFFFFRSIVTKFPNTSGTLNHNSLAQILNENIKRTIKYWWFSPRDTDSATNLLDFMSYNNNPRSSHKILGQC